MMPRIFFALTSWGFGLIAWALMGGAYITDGRVGYGGIAAITAILLAVFGSRV